MAKSNGLGVSTCSRWTSAAPSDAAYLTASADGSEKSTGTRIRFRLFMGLLPRRHELRRGLPRPAIARVVDGPQVVPRHDYPRTRVHALLLPPRDRLHDGVVDIRDRLQVDVDVDAARQRLERVHQLRHEDERRRAD